MEHNRTQSSNGVLLSGISSAASVLVLQPTISYFEVECWEEAGSRWSSSVRYDPLLGTYVWVLVHETSGLARAGFAGSVERSHAALDTAAQALIRTIGVPDFVTLTGDGLPYPHALGELDRSTPDAAGESATKSGTP